MSSQSADIGTYVRLPKEDREALLRLAEASKRTLSGEIRFAVAQYLAEHEREAA